jgi:hypothetical protein
MPHHAEISEYFFLCFFTHGTGIEQDEISIIGAIGLFVNFARHTGRSQNIGHFVGVVLIHLATEGADENFSRHAGMGQGEIKKKRKYKTEAADFTGTCCTLERLLARWPAGQARVQQCAFLVHGLQETCKQSLKISAPPLKFGAAPHSDAPCRAIV